MREQAKCAVSSDPQLYLDHSCFFSISLPLMHTNSLKHSLDFSKFTEQALYEALNEKILGKERGKKTSVSPAD